MPKYNTIQYLEKGEKEGWEVGSRWGKEEGEEGEWSGWIGEGRGRVVRYEGHFHHLRTGQTSNNH